MSELYIDRTVFRQIIAEGKPLPADLSAKTYAAGLPDWHPVKRLLDGEWRRVGENENIFGFLCLISEVYKERLQRADESGVSWTLPQLDQAAIEAADAEFEACLPDDVLYRGRHFSLRALLMNAREATAIAAEGIPFMRTVYLDALNRTFIKLVRAIRHARDTHVTPRDFPPLRAITQS